MYRMPWSLTDNVLAWLEPTKRCNLSCKGCYSRNDPQSEKSLEQVRREMDAFARQRKVDSISIAGGDPLTHPQIVEIVRMVRHDYGLKPVVNTNGIELEERLLDRLQAAGVSGFTFHIDSGQKRRGWHGKSEIELNALRQHYADLLQRAGGLSCAFNATIYPDTVDQVPALLDWGAAQIDRVHGLVFILFRTMRTADFDYFVHGRKVDMDAVVYEDQEINPDPLTTPEAVAVVRRQVPDFRPAAYLGGTVDPNSLKWTIAARMGDGERVYGWVGPRFMELVQQGHHLATGRYLAYSKPELLAMGRSLLAVFGPLDDGVRGIAGAWAKHVLRHPADLRRHLHLQSVLFIQPIDHLPDGSTNMCDGCPDMTVHEGELVWSCRLDERLRYGCWLQAAPRANALRGGAAAQAP
jgi:hypothetical protein